MVERALAAADAAEIEAQHREAAMRKRVVALVDDLVVHRAVKLRMRVQDHGDRGVLLLRRVVAAFEAAGRAGENHFRHRDPLIDVDQSIGWRGLRLRQANEAAREMDCSRRRAARCGARSSMTQGAKIKEIVWLGGRETASWASGKGLDLPHPADAIAVAFYLSWIALRGAREGGLPLRLYACRSGSMDLPTASTSGSASSSCSVLRGAGSQETP